MEQLARLGLEGKYPHLIQGLTEGFDVGVPQIQRTYAPPNHASIKSLAGVYSKIIDSEFTAGRYIGLFSRNQLERALGPFQSSPLYLVPKTTSPGTYRAVHNFSHPHTSPLQMPHPSTPTSTATISCAPGAPSQRLPYSSPASPQAPRPPSTMSQRHTGRFLSGPTNGPGSSSGCRQMTSLWSMSATILASHWLGEYMGRWQMPEPTSSEGMGWAHWQSGWMIMFSSKSHEYICIATMPSARYGVRRFKRTGATGRREVDYGMEGRPSPVAWQKSLMRTAKQASTTSLSSPHNQKPIVTSPTQMQTLIGSHMCWVSNGRAPRSSPLAKRCLIWGFAGTCTRRSYTYQMRKRPSTWQQSRSGRRNAHITSSKLKNSTVNYRTLLWLSQQDALISQTWRPCSPPSTIVLSFHTRPCEATKTTSPGGNPDSSSQTSPSLSPGPIPLLSTEHSRTQALVSAWKLRWAHDGGRCIGLLAGNPKGGTSSGLRPSDLNSSQSVFLHYQARATMSSYMETTGESSRGGGKSVVPTGPPTMFSDTSSSFRRIAAEQYIQDTYQAQKTQQMPLLEVSTPPFPHAQPSRRPERGTIPPHQYLTLGS